MTAPLTTLAPCPLPLAELPSAADPARLGAERLRALRRLADRPWTSLSWPALLDELMAVGRTDIPLARLVEGHADAVRILAELGGRPLPSAVYGVWASRSHATGVRLEGDRIVGTLRFASGVGAIDRALVPVWVDDRHHQLFDVDVYGWEGDASSWRTGAMAASRSLTVEVDEPRPAVEVGALDSYLQRPGFFPGGIGVAAVWAGGAARVVDLTLRWCRGAPESAQRTARWGAIRLELACAAALLDSAGRTLAAGHGLGDDGRGLDLSTEVRAAVARSVRAVVEQCRALAGPAGLAYDADLTQALDDLALYVAQENADSSARHLGGLLESGC